MQRMKPYVKYSAFNDGTFPFISRDLECLVSWLVCLDGTRLYAPVLGPCRWCCAQTCQCARARVWISLAQSRRDECNNLVRKLTLKNQYFH
jgi:hypothetical protein